MVHILSSLGLDLTILTKTAASHQTEQIKPRLEKKGVIGAVFLDRFKACDTGNHNVLVSKRFKFNFSSRALAWIPSYLSGKIQCVNICGVLSSNMKCTAGVPQGSVLGPLLLSLYINNLPQQHHWIVLQIYADDNALYTHADTPELAAKKLSVAMKRVTEWLGLSCLSDNISKTEGVFFSKANKHQTQSGKV